MKKLLSACLLSTSLLLACSNTSPEASVDDEGCEHLQQGPNVALSATASASGAPSVSNDHKRYDVTLTDVSGGKGGSVSFASSEATDYVIFLGADVPLAVATSNGQAVPFEASSTSSSTCGDIRGRHVVPLEVGTYTLTFGPTSATRVSVVIEEMAAEGHEH